MDIELLKQLLNFQYKDNFLQFSSFKTSKIKTCPNKRNKILKKE